MLCKLRLATLLAFGLAAPALLHAQKTITVPTATYPTIQSGIDAASSGDTVTVTVAKTYYENIDFKGKGIQVNTSSSLAPGAAVIDGSGAGPVVTIVGVDGLKQAADSGISGFTIQNGGKPQTAGGPQGGIYISNSRVQLTYNTIVNNFCAGINGISSEAEIGYSDISHTLTTGCAAAEGLGSGIAMNGYFASGDITNVYFSKIHDNTASVGYTTNGGDKGGGAAINFTNLYSAEIQNTIMYNNATTGYGGAFYVAGTPYLFFVNNLIYGNKGVSGGLDIVVPGKSVGPLVGLIANNTIADNMAVGSNAGSDIYISGNLAQYALVNNIVVGYTNGQVAVNCGVTYQDQTVTPLVIDHNDFYSVPGSGNTPIGGYCTTPPTQLGNFSKDPMFVHGTAADVAGTSGNAVDFSLLAGSPAIDAGNNSTALTNADVAGKSRFQYGGVAGSAAQPIIDLGAYEYGNGTSVGPSLGMETFISLIPSTYTPASNGSVTLLANLLTYSPSGSVQTGPTGTVDFYEDYAVVGSGVITPSTNGGGSATLVLKNLTPGLHNLQAVYAGQSGYPPGISIDVIISATVGITTPTVTTITSSLNPSTVGQSVTFTANVASSNGVPDGQIVFSLDTNSTLCAAQAADASGNATCSSSALTAGSHIITATYLPNGTAFGSSSASLTQVVNATPITTSMTLASSVNPSIYQQSVTFTAVVSSGSNGTPTGSVNFYDGATLISSQPFSASTANSATATLPDAGLAIGSHALSAVFVPTGSYVTSNASLTQVVNSVDTTMKITSSLNPSGFGQLVTFLATVSPNPVSNAGYVTGSVNFYDGTTLLSSQTFGQIGCNNCAPGSRSASFSLSTLSIGSHTITAVYVPLDNTFLTSSASLTQVVVAVTPVTLSLTSSLNPSLVTQSVTFTAKMASVDPVNGVPTGSVTFYDGATPLSGQPLINGVASYSTTTLAAGSHNISAVYTPTGFYGQASNALTQVVNFVDTSTVLTFSPNPPSPAAPLVMTATITPAATISTSLSGNVYFFVDGNLLGTVPVTPSGIESFTVPSIPVGQHSLACSYSGDINYKTSSCTPSTVTVTLAPTTLTVSSVTNPSPAVTPVTFTAQLLSGTTPVAGATITISATGLSPQSGILSGPTTGVTNAQGIATVTYAGFYPGAYGIKAIYAGDAAHAASASTTIPETVFINPTTMTLIAAPNPAPEGTAVTLAIDVAATDTTTPPPGTVTVFDGGAPLVTLPLTLNGSLSSASFTTSSLVAGTHNLTATYTPTVMPDPPFQPTQTTAALAVVITPLSFDLSTDKPTISIQTEHHGAMTLTVTPVGNFTGYAYLSCTGTLPPVLQCEFAKTPLLVSNAAASTTLTLETDAIPNFWGSLAPQRERSHRREEIALATLLPLALLGLTRKRRKLVTTLAALCLLTFATTLTGCGDKWPDHTPPGTYDIAITATGNTGQRAITSTVHVTLTVTP